MAKRELSLIQIEKSRMKEREIPRHIHASREKREDFLIFLPSQYQI